MRAPQSTVFINSHLYDQDFYLWIETTAKQLKDGRFSKRLFEKSQSILETPLQTF
jgi:Domain of unknown function DUF29